MQPGEENNRPDGRQSYLGNEGGIARRPIMPERPVVRPNVPSATPPSPVEQPLQPQQPIQSDQAPTPTQPQSYQPSPEPSVPPQVPPAPVSQEMPTQPVGMPPEPTKLDFTAPKKEKKKLIKIPRVRLTRRVLTVLAMLAGAGLAVFAVMSVMSWQSTKSDPATMLRESLDTSLGVASIQMSKTSSSLTSSAVYDFSKAKDPIISSDVTVKRYDSSFNISTYGTSSDTFYSYTGLPSTVDTSLAEQAKGKWVQLRKSKVLDHTVSHEVSGLADPRIQLFGPILVANLDDKDREQTVNFLVKNNVYKFKAEKFEKAKVGDQKALVMPVVLDVGYLKVAMQTAALTMGYTPADIAEAIRAIDVYKSAKADLYISSRGHKILRLDITDSSGNKTQYDYSNFDEAKVSAQPTVSMPWAEFAPTHWKIEAAPAVKQPGQVLDTTRQKNLNSMHDALASYSAQNGYYPSLAKINDLSWLKNVALAAPELQRDPLATTLTLLTAPKAGAYAYMPSPANCDNAKAVCSQYRLIATQSDGKPYVVTSP